MDFIFSCLKSLRSAWKFTHDYQRECLILAFVSGIVIFMAIPDVIIGLVLETAHILFEMLESGLDKLIEHLFDTDGRQTQIIVFYILLGLGGLLSYGLCRIVPVWYAYMKEELSVTYVRLQIHANLYWQSMSLSHKIYWYAGTGVLVLGLGFWLLS